MDFQNRAGGKTGSGGVASWSESNRDRRERLRQLALETIDLNKVSKFVTCILLIMPTQTFGSFTRLKPTELSLSISATIASYVYILLT